LQRVVEGAPECVRADDGAQSRGRATGRVARRVLDREVRRAAGGERDADQVDDDRQLATERGVSTALRPPGSDRAKHPAEPNEWYGERAPAS
jgi:hypothetical protein